MLAEYDENGTLITSYTRADQLISQERNGEKSYYLYDGFDSVRMLTDNEGVITDTYNYDAFGNLTSSAGNTENSFLYRGEQFDSFTGLYYLRARYMNPSTGTFITMDEYAGSIFEPVSLHKYLYANANPVTYCDPSGYNAKAGNYSLKGLMIGMACLTALSAVILPNYSNWVNSIGFANSTLTANTIFADVDILDWNNGLTKGVTTPYIIVSSIIATIIASSIPKSTTKERDKRQNSPRSGWIAYGELDELGRATGAQALITKDMIKTGSVASIIVVGIEKYYDRGHLIASNLGGSGVEPRNLTPVHQHFNRGYMRIIENRVATFASLGIDTYMEVTPYYEEDSLIPDYIMMYISNSCIDETYMISNEYHY